MTLWGSASARTLWDFVAGRGAADPDGLYLTLFDRPLTCSRLHATSLRYAGALAGLGLGPGDKVVLVLPTCEEFFFAFFGAVAIGAVPVPLYPTLAPELKARIFRDAEAQAVITVDWFRDDVEAARAEAPAVRHYLTPDRLEEGSPPARLPALREDDVCFLQYTSGSTAVPRGVVLTHANVVATVRLMREAVGMGPADTVVSWLPLYHDMGLIGCGFVPLYTGAPLVLLPPDLRNPRAWLEAITAHRGVFTVAPDFGYRNCVRNVGDPTGLDLGSLRMALSGAETVRLSTIRAFEERFAVKNAFCPAYGLAEATLAVAIWPPGHPVRLDDSGSVVSVGHPCPGVRVAIAGADGRPGAAVGAGGEILVQSPGVMQGYYRDPDASDRVLRDGWLHTEDLGFLDAEGYLYVTGRIKDLIIVGGANVAPADVEEIVDGLSWIRYSAAVGIESARTGTQRLHIVAELRHEAVPADQLSALARGIAAELHRRRGLRPARVLLVRPHTIPKTSSGKIQRAALAAQLAAGTLGDCVLHATGSAGG
ncbi:MAG TPA: AMP-binding protein [Methylomirabilota bacterium]|jgi:acyl-CoA synthetase (AMP-forming)/AMP-acid ligase II|nr:AMP-binding protein [Methylomirabilota bacterium]